MRVVAGEQRWEWVRPAAGDERFAHGGGGYLRLKDVARMHRSPAAGRDSDGRGRAAQGADAQDLEALEELELEDDELQQADVCTNTNYDVHEHIFRNTVYLNICM